MKETLVPIDKAGRVVLPKDLRKELAIQPGDLLKVSVRGNEVTLRLNRQKSGFTKRGRALVFSAGDADVLDNETVNSVLQNEREKATADMEKDLPQKR